MTYSQQTWLDGVEGSTPLTAARLNHMEAGIASAGVADVHAATSKTTPVDADELALYDSASSFSLKKLTFANLKAAITSITGNAGTATKLVTARDIDGQSFDGSANVTVIAPGTHAATGKSTPVDADEIPLVDTASSNTLKKLTWANLKAGITTITGNAGTATVLATARNIDGQSFNGSADITVIAPGTHAASAKTTPADADEFPIIDSAASNVLKKFTWSNMKSLMRLHRITYVSGNYYWCNSAGNAASNVTGGFSLLRVTPWVVETTVSITKLFAEVTNAGTAGNTVRLGIYADNGSGQPGALVVDAGTIDGASATVQEVTVSLTLTPGIYWVGGAPQGATTQPGVRGVGAGIIDTDWGVPLGTSLPAANTSVYGFQKTSVSGALPDPFGSTTTTTSAIRVGFKTA